MDLVLHPRHGVHTPATSTPARRPNSVRRTSSVEILRPDGVAGALHLIGRARDLHTDEKGSPQVTGTGQMHATVDYRGGQLLTGLRAGDPGCAAQLIGARASSGFRARLKQAYAHDAERCTPVHLLLDDLPVCVLISGHAVSASTQGRRDEDELRGYPLLEVLSARVDQCAGFAEAGTIMTGLRDAGRSPVVTGPAAPALERDDDPWAWHAMPALPPHGMRRRRRLDLWQDGDMLGLNAMFRDTYVLADGTETIIHEYTIDGTAEPEGLQILSLTSTAQVLPWVECPRAAASGSRLVGQTVHDLRSHVRAEFYGTSTCTHLNDALRSLEDVTALRRAL